MVPIGGAVRGQLDERSVPERGTRSIDCGPRSRTRRPSDARLYLDYGAVMEDKYFVRPSLVASPVTVRMDAGRQPSDLEYVCNPLLPVAATSATAGRPDLHPCSGRNVSVYSRTQSTNGSGDSDACFDQHSITLPPFITPALFQRPVMTAF